MDYLGQRFPFDDNHEILAELRGIIRSARATPIADVRYENGPAHIPIRLFRRNTPEGNVVLGVACNFRTSGHPLPSDALLNSAEEKIEILMSDSSIVRDLLSNRLVGTKSGQRPIRRSSFEAVVPVFQPRLFHLKR